MNKDYSEDEKPHILVIHSKYDSERGGDWTVEHLDDCPIEIYSSGDFEEKHEPLEYYNCRLQAAIDGNGLDDIEDWKELEPGEYKIKSYYQYWPGEYGGESDAEHEIGIFLYLGE